MPAIPLEKLIDAYRVFDVDSLAQLDGIYEEDLLFVDPVHRLAGRDAVRDYLVEMARGLISCRFEFSDVLDSEAEDGNHQALLTWQMHYRHPRLAGGQALALPGCTHVKYRERVYYQRDYYDLGAMVYEQLPGLGFAIKQVKKRLEHS